MFAVWCRLKSCLMKKSVAANWTMTCSPAIRNSLTTAPKSWTRLSACWAKTARSRRLNGRRHPFAVLSSQPRIIYDYFRQQFAQVTNPPIDPLREAHVMSLATSIGREMNVFCEAEGQAHRLSFKSPILLYSDFKQLTTMSEHHYRADWLDITFDVTETTLDATVKALCDKAEQMVRNGTVLLVLSDRNIGKNRLPVPAPMAVGAVQTRLVEQSLRCDANIIVETGSARDPHHFAVLLGFGATAIYPYRLRNAGASD